MEYRKHIGQWWLFEYHTEWIKLEWIEKEKDLLDIASGGHWIDHGQTQFMVRTDDVERTDSFRRFGVAHLIFVDHIELNSQFAFCISDDWIWKFAGNIQAVRFDVLTNWINNTKSICQSDVSIISRPSTVQQAITYIHPIDMALQVVDRMRQQFDIALLEMRLMHCDTAELCGAHRREVTWMRKNHHPSAYK